MENTENHIRRGEGWIQEEEQSTWPAADVQLRVTTMTPANTNICDPVKDSRCVNVNALRPSHLFRLPRLMQKIDIPRYQDVLEWVLLVSLRKYDGFRRSW